MAAKINWRQNDVTVALCIAGDVCPASPVASTPMRPEPTHQRIVAADRTRVEVRPGDKEHFVNAARLVTRAWSATYG